MSRSNVQQHLLEVSRQYNASLTPDVLGYLAARGVSPEAADGHLLGVATDPGPEHEPYRGRLSIPYITLAGVRAIKFRCMRDHDCSDAGCPKYLCTDASRVHLYNVSALLQDGSTVAVCEGELDAVVCSTAVGIPAVAVAGVAAWLPHFPRLFAGFDRVILLGDNDTPKRKNGPDGTCVRRQCREDGVVVACKGHNPGQEFSRRIAGDLEQAVIIPPPVGHDVTSWVLQDGADAVRKKLS